MRRQQMEIHSVGMHQHRGVGGRRVILGDAVGGGVRTESQAIKRRGEIRRDEGVLVDEFTSGRRGHWGPDALHRAVDEGLVVSER